MTWNEYQRAVNGYEMREMREWDRTRRIATEAFNTLNEKPIPYWKYMELGIDDVEGMTRRDVAQSLTAYDKILERQAARDARRAAEKVATSA